MLLTTHLTVAVVEEMSSVLTVVPLKVREGGFTHPLLSSLYDWGTRPRQLLLWWETWQCLLWCTVSCIKKRSPGGLCTSGSVSLFCVCVHACVLISTLVNTCIFHVLHCSSPLCLATVTACTGIVIVNDWSRTVTLTQLSSPSSLTLPPELFFSLNHCHLVILFYSI